MERNDWKVLKLGDFCDLKAGKNVKVSEIKQECDEINKYPCYGGNGIRGYIKKYSHCLIYPIIGRQGALCGNVTLAKAPFYATEHAVVVKPRSETNITWLYYKLRSLNLNQYAQGVAQPGLAVSTLNKIPIPVPPLPVQARIVDELDCLQGILSKKRQQLAEYHSLAQAIFHQMFGDPVVNEKGWEVKKWKELFDTKLGKMLDRSQHTSSQKQYPYLANTNVQWGYFDLSDLRTMPFSDEELIKYDLEENDLLICEGGESGRCAIWHNKYSNQNILFQKAIHRARIKKANTVDITYISYFIRYSKELGGLKDYISKSTIEHLTGEKLKSLPIPLPPLPLQQSFAARIAAIDSQRERLAASIRELETLFACRMETLLNCPQA